MAVSTIDYLATTIEIPDCVGSRPAIDGTVIGWGLFLGALIIGAFIASIAIVRYRAHELKPDRLKRENERLQIAANREVELAKQHKQCLTCGDVYGPVST